MPSRKRRRSAGDGVVSRLLSLDPIALVESVQNDKEQLEALANFADAIRKQSSAALANIRDTESKTLRLSLLEQNRERQRMIVDHMSEHNPDDAMLILSLLRNEEIKAERRIPRMLLRRSILPYEMCTWKHLYETRSDRAFVIFTGFNVKSFHELLKGFQPLYRSTTMRNLPQGQYFKELTRRMQRQLPAHAALGMILRWAKSTCDEYDLCLHFGCIPATVSRFLSYALALLNEVVASHPLAQITFPSVDQQLLNSYMISDKYDLLAGAVGSLDGLRLPLKEDPDPIAQNKYYNGWTKQVCTANVLLWSPDGTIAAAVYNCMGNLHDSTVCEVGDIYTTMKEQMPPDMYYIADSAFGKVADSLTGGRKIRRVSKISEAGPQNDFEALWEEQVRRFRQTAEWGNAHLVRTFPRLKTKWSATDHHFRSLAFSTIFHLSNFRTRMMGRNEIKTVFEIPGLYDSESED